MNYRKDRLGNNISLLGYGCMRFTKNGSSIDIDKATEEVKLAIDNGVNYFDTAYTYPGNEVAVGEIFERLKCRKDVYIATKLPQYLVKSTAQFDKFFDEELKRLKTDYIDYYLMHLITDIAAWEKLERLGIREWIEEKKKKGQIKNIGFSFHGNSENFIKVVDAYDWDFCQIQYNYMDEHSQAGRTGLMHAYNKGIPVIIMEPLRGGRLVNLLPDEAKKLIAGHKSGRSAAEWAFRWLWEQPEVTCVLSGMNSLEMLNENLRIASEVKEHEFTDDDRAMIEEIKSIVNKKIIDEHTPKRSPAEWAFRWLMQQEAVTCVLSGMNSKEMILENARIASEVQINEFTESDDKLIEDVKAEIGKTIKVPCTGCNYCMPCPNNVDIPGTFSCYNSMFSESKMSGRTDYMKVTAFNKTRRDAAACIGCGKCEKHCPQAIKIREELKNADKALRPWYIKLATSAVRLFKFW